MIYIILLLIGMLIGAILHDVISKPIVKEVYEPFDAYGNKQNEKTKREPSKKHKKRRK